MANVHWSGHVICETVAKRDEYLALWRDLVDAELDVVEHPHNIYPSGLHAQNNLRGEVITGPAFTFSLKISEEKYRVPPDGEGLGQNLEALVGADDSAEAVWNAGGLPN